MGRKRLLAPLAAGLALLLASPKGRADPILDFTNVVPIQVYSPVSAGGPKVVGRETAFVTETMGVRQYDVEGNLIRTLTFPTSSISGLGYDPADNSLFASDNQGSIWTSDLDSTRGGWNYRGTTGLINFSIRDIAVAGDKLAILDESASDGNYYLRFFDKGNLSLTGEVSLSGIISEGDSFDGLGRDKLNDLFYLSSLRSGSPHIYGVRLSSDLSSITDVEDFSLVSQTLDLPEYAYGVGGSENGLSVIGVRDGNFGNYFGNVVPEPSTLLLLAAGAAGMRRKRS